MTPLNLETVFGTVLSLLIAAMWYWVRGIADGLKEARHERDELLGEINKVKIDYATKAEARADAQQVMASLGRLESKMDKMSDKLDRKADK